MAYVAVEKDGEPGIGSAFHVGDGIFVTARHVVEGAIIREMCHEQSVKMSLSRVQYINQVLGETYGKWREFLVPLRGGVLHEVSDLDNAIGLCTCHEKTFIERANWVRDVLEGKEAFQGMTYLEFQNWYTRSIYGLPLKPGAKTPVMPERTEPTESGPMDYVM